MDTSPEYIKMCAKAIEIQELWKPKWGDFIADKGDYSQAVVLLSVKNISQNDLVWLPRQDQLQSIHQKAFEGATDYAFIISFAHFCREESDHSGYLYPVSEKTTEQMMLSFIMMELYDKYWNGEDWINEGEVE